MASRRQLRLGPCADYIDERRILKLLPADLDFGEMRIFLR